MKGVTRLAPRRPFPHLPPFPHPFLTSFLGLKDLEMFCHRGYKKHNSHLPGITIHSNNSQ